MHSRGFGVASHLGVQFDIPTIGISKTAPENADGQNKSIIQCEFYEGGDTAPLIGKYGKTWGVAMRFTKDSTNLTYISIGHRVSLNTAIAITKLTIGKSNNKSL